MPSAKKLQSYFFIKLGGADASPTFMRDLEYVKVENSLHLPDVATLVLHDPALNWIDDANLEPGKTIKISAQAGSGEELLFDGEIIEIEPEFSPETQRLVVRAFDRLHRLMRGRQVRSFVNVTDGDIIQKIAQEVGLRTKLGPTAQVHEYVLQANETNLTFLQRRAAALGYLLYVDGETLHCAAPESSGTAVELNWGSTLLEFRPRMTTVGQVNDVTVRGWDPKAKREVVSTAQDAKIVPKVGVGTSGGAMAKKAFNLEAHYLVANGPVRMQKEADLLAQATADRLGGRFIEADGRAAGNPSLIAGVQAKLVSVGNRFSGTYYVTGTTHVYDTKEGYQTDFTVSGLHPLTLLSMIVPEQEPPPTSGLVIGVVTDNKDPDNLGRVKVKYPWLSNDHASYWARVIIVGGGKNRGIEFLPEINDEVLIGFEQGDVNSPYILGGLWNGRDNPPLPNSQAVSGGQVQKRVIRSRTGHDIILDDADAGGGITIIDKAKNVITLNAQDKSVTIESQGEMKLKAKGNLSIETQGEMKLKAQGNVSVEGNGQMNLKAQSNVTVEGNGQVSVKGMGAELNGQGGTVSVRGSMINLN